MIFNNLKETLRKLKDSLRFISDSLKLKNSLSSQLPYKYTFSPLSWFLSLLELVLLIKQYRQKKEVS